MYKDYKYEKYVGKRIKITHLDGFITEGLFDGYTDDNNDEDGANITVTNNGHYLGAYVKDIKSIEIIG